MEIHSLEPVLAEHPFFRDLQPNYLKLLVGCASNIRFEAGQFLFREGQEANNFFLIREGRVALETAVPGHESLILQTKDGGEILGWSWLVPPYHWPVDARAVQTTRALTLDGACLRRKCEEDRELGYELLKRFVQVIEQELAATRLRLVDIYAAPAARGGGCA